MSINIPHLVGKLWQFHRDPRHKNIRLVKVILSKKQIKQGPFFREFFLFWLFYWYYFGSFFFYFWLESLNIELRICTACHTFPWKIMVEKCCEDNPTNSFSWYFWLLHWFCPFEDFTICQIGLFSCLSVKWKPLQN